jgi:uncharacterized protein (DUF2336 family)
MSPSLALVNELQEAIARGSAGRRREMLCSVTDLVLAASERCSDDEVALLDDVIVRLATDIEREARALLAERLAAAANAPPRIMRLLASDDAIEVARPVLVHSQRLDDPFLIETARTKSQQHLHAISRRRTLSEAVTDVLVERGDRPVVLCTVENAGARFSERGFAALVKRSAGDDALATRVSARPELPAHLFLKLLATASKAVRIKLEAEHPRARREVHHVVAEVTQRIRTEARAGWTDYAAAHATVQSLHASGQLDSTKVEEFAKNHRLEETIAAIALMCELPIDGVESAMTDQRPETLLILARAVGLSWTATKALLHLRAGKRGMSIDDIEQCLAGFERLKRTTAQQLLRFRRVREGGGSPGRS